MLEQIAKSAGQTQTTIGGRVYTLSLMDALPGMVLAKKLISVAAPALASLFDKGKKEDYLLPEEDFSLTEVAFVVATQLDKLEIDQITQQLLRNVYCNGQPIDVNEHFRGDYGSLITLIEFALKENFSDFFTKYLKAKGLEMPTLRGFLKQTDQKEETPSS